jgi:hypothetical protein
MAVFLERWVLPVLAAVFIGVMILNTMR